MKVEAEAGAEAEAEAEVEVEVEAEAVPLQIGVHLAAVPTSPAETLLHKVGRVTAVLELDPALSLVNAIKTANELVGIGPAQGAPTATLLSQVDTLLATIGI